MARTFKLITVSGAPHAGKTTVADIIVSKRPNTILIELDKIRHVYRHSSQAPWYVVEDAICLMDLWFRRDQDVILLGPFWKRGYEDLINRTKRDLKNWDISYHHFTLAPPIGILSRIICWIPISEKRRLLPGDWLVNGNQSRGKFRF